jgi:hypothetical protein
MGNKIFKWYVAGAVDDEVFNSKHNTREEALASAQAEYGEDPFVLIEADPSVVKANLSTEWVIEKILEDLEENNEQCWGEDGPDNPWGDTKPLEKAIEKAVADWLIACPPKTFCVDEFRTTEAFNGAML